MPLSSISPASTSRNNAYPALKDHDPKALVGHTDKVSTDGQADRRGQSSAAPARQLPKS
jgi:hypothetical protein